MTDTTTGTGPLHPEVLGRVILRGLGQVMFQRNEFTGLLFLAGMAIASPWVAVGAAAGAVIGPLVALLLRFDRGEILDGLYGYNAALVGAAALSFLQFTPLTWGLALVGASVSVPLTWLLRRVVPFPTYTTAFVLTAWGLLFVADGLGDRQPEAPPKPATAVDARPRWERFAAQVADGIAEVMFGANVATGACFLAGLAIGSWRHALVAVVGASLGTIVAAYHHDPQAQLDLGLYGYNAALAAIAGWLARPSWLAVIVAAAASVPLVEFFPAGLGFPALTAPFIMAAWIVLAILALDRGTSACI